MKRIFSITLSLILALNLSVLCSANKKNVIYSWHPNSKNIALTFDDGPHPVHTAEILEILSEYDIKATFFLIGQNAQWYPSLVEAEYELGHEIANHTYSHQCLRNMNYDSITDQIKKCENTLSDKIKIKTSLLRPPGGMMNEHVIRAAEDTGYKVVCWSVDTEDWAHTPPDKIAENVLNSVKEGDIILFHDFVSGDSPTPEALRIIIPALLEEGYNFVTVSELLNS